MTATRLAGKSLRCAATGCFCRPTDDPKYVMIYSEFDDAAKAEAFRTTLRNIWNNNPAVQRIMQDPVVRVVEAVETKEL